jgi:hypothetical protein
VVVQNGTLPYGYSMQYRFLPLAVLLLCIIHVICYFTNFFFRILEISQAQFLFSVLVYNYCQASFPLLIWESLYFIWVSWWGPWYFIWDFWHFIGAITILNGNLKNIRGALDILYGILHVFDPCTSIACGF